MRTGWKPLANQADDASLNSSETLGKLQVVHTVEATTSSYRLVLPCDAKEIAGGYIPQTNAAQLFHYLAGNQSWILHLSKCWDDDVSLTRSFDCSLYFFFSHGEVNHDTDELLSYFFNLISFASGASRTIYRGRPLASS